MSTPITTVVGLGNPGPRYAETRHNVGFWLVDRLALARGTVFRHAARFHGEVAELPGLRLLKPGTYMNHSGQSVGALARFYRLAPESLLVVHDELDLDPGVARLKQGGGHGGHNGLRDVAAALGSREFARVRLGIGHPGNAREVVDYVLSRPRPEEREAIESAMEAVLDLLPQVLDGRLEHAMNTLHRAP
jgi:PTH1 family peptidyl-tRNA hydrolase